MAKTPSQHAQAWRNRMMLRSSFFHEFDRQRRRVLADQFDDQDQRPEYLAVKRFFLAYPRCTSAPETVSFGNEGYWSISFTEPDPDNEAAVLIAMSEVTSAPAYVERVGDGSSAMLSLDMLDVSTIKAEVAEMRALGIWNPEA